MPDLSVVISTYNRSESLGETLESLNGQQLPEGLSVELVVVDNNSTDGTKGVVERFSRSAHWPVRHLFEPRQGISFGRNTGIRHARAPLIAFMDDDVRPDPHWAREMIRCFQETDAEVVGGKVGSIDAEALPPWLLKQFVGPFGSLDLGPDRRQRTPTDPYFVNFNLAARRELFDKYGLFDERMGRFGDRLTGGEDTEMFERWLQAGCRLYFEPRAFVRHKILPERLSKEYLRSWSWMTGRTIGHQMQTGSYRFKEPPGSFWLARILKGALAKFIWTQLRPDIGEVERFADYRNLLFHLGFLAEWFAHRFSRFGMGRFCVFKVKNPS